MPSPKKILLPQLQLTETTSGVDPDAIAVNIPSPSQEASTVYFVKPKVSVVASGRKSGEPYLQKQQFNLFPVVLDSNGVPWAEAVIYLLSRIENAVAPVMTTYAGIAEDLATYRRFMDKYGIDWTNFPAQKAYRPTYRFNGHLKYAVADGTVAATTARRQMGTVIGFYRWLTAERVLSPKYPPWKESDRYIEFKDSRGFGHTKKVITTDVAIKVPKQNNPYDEAIEDGGKLRPLPLNEQEWVMDALVASGNTEMTLIHLFGFLTGARIQTILTFRVRHVLLQVEEQQTEELRVPIGPGTGIDTKNNKRMVLHIPVWFYKMLRIYAHSARANKRRARAAGGDHMDQYLFLSVRGAPLYQSKADSSAFDATNKLRHSKSGQGVRQFITERVIPFVRKKYNSPAFHYQFHDTRATAGMNLTDHQLTLVEQGKATLHEVREYVRVWMGHESSATTDRYLQYRQNLRIARWAEHRYEGHLKNLSQRAMEGLVYDRTYNPPHRFS